MTINRRLLVVDDDPGVRDAYAAVFRLPSGESDSERMRLAAALLGVEPPRVVARQQAFDLTVARQGREAAQILSQRLAEGAPPAVAFVDMRMPPGWDGLTTIEELWRIDPRLQCVLCTAYSDFSWEEIVGRLGSTDRLLILRKPFDRIEVLQMAEALCAKWTSAEEAQGHAREVARQRTLLRGIIDHAGLLITLKDATGRYLLANEGFCRRHELPEAALIGHTDAEVFPDADGLDAREAEARSTGFSRVEEDDPLLGRGRLATVRFLLPGNAPDQSLLCTVAHDVTELRDLESRYRQSLKMEALGRLAGGIAHDFNNLLAAIMGFTELAMAGRLEDRTRGQLTQVLNAGQQAADLTRQLLAFSRRQVLKPQDLEVITVVRDLVAMLNRLVGGQVTIAIVERGPSRVRMDRSQLQQVLVNLVVNARDAMPRGGTVTISVGPAEDPAQVRLSIADEGVGMGPDVLAHIWDPFFTTKAEGRGTGLGLSTVHGIVLQSGGTIAVDSQRGQGTTVTILLPAVSTEVAPVAPAEPVLPVGGTERILVADDHAEVRHLVGEILGQAGYHVEEAEDHGSLEGDPRIETTDLVLTDVMMPGINGPELAERLRLRRAGLRVLFMTGHAVQPDGIPGPVLTKPFSHAELLAAVRQALA